MVDLSILSKLLEKHVNYLRKIFRGWSKCDLKLTIDKCKFFQRQLKCFGFILDASGIKPDREPTKKVIAWQEPTDIPTLLRVICMNHWLHGYISRSSDYL